MKLLLLVLLSLTLLLVLLSLTLLLSGWQAPARGTKRAHLPSLPACVTMNIILPAESDIDRLEELARQVRQAQIVNALLVLGRTEHDDLDRLQKWGLTVESLAEMTLRHAEAHGLDPLLLVAIAWKESRFIPTKEGDHRKGRPRSCGITGVRTDYPGRPTCAELKNPDFALGWTATFLAATKKADGQLNLSKYNGGQYEALVWRTVDWLRSSI